MAKVRLLQAVAMRKAVMEPGDTLDVDERTAIEWMATGVAERVDGPQVIACVRETFSTATRKAAKRAR
jgi:hypothetical protein